MNATVSAIIWLAMGSLSIGLATTGDAPFLFGYGLFCLGIAGLYAQARR